MAAIDISLLSSVSTIIVFLLFFIGGWGVLTMVNPFKDSGKNLYGLLAFLLALIMVLTPAATQVVMTATPWLILLVMIGFFFIFYAMMFGVKEAGITAIIKDAKGWLITLVVVIMLFAIGTSFGPSLTKAQFPGQGGEPIDPNEPVFDAQGNLVPAGSLNGGTAGGVGSTATDDFGSNLVFTLFHPKILGVFFIFILGTLTVVMITPAAK